jgi:hypothetical protein
LIRPPSSGWTWRKLMSFSSVAEKSFTGIVTSPKEIAPFQIERGMFLVCPIRCRVHSYPRPPARVASSALKLVELLGRKPQQVVLIEYCCDLGRTECGRQALPCCHFACNPRRAYRRRFVTE